MQIAKLIFIRSSESWKKNTFCHYFIDYIREMLEKAGFTARIGTEHLFVSVHDAVIHAVGMHSEVSLRIRMNLFILRSHK